MNSPRTVLVDVHAAQVAFAGRPVLAPLTAQICAGDEIAVIGRSGSGKTTLLLLLAGLLEPTSGVVTRHERSIGSVPQAASLIDDLSVLENVVLPLRLHDGGDPTGSLQRARRALDEVGLTTLDAVPGELSGGQQQRVAIARTLASGARLVLADEPTAALDAGNGQRIVAALRRHREQTGGALVIATHDPSVAEHLGVHWHVEDGELRKVDQCA